METDRIAKRLEISGVVQGVGFRPFLFGLAKTHKLYGQVSNSSSGVDVVVEGRSEVLEQFCTDIVEKSPLLASVTEIKSQPTKLRGYTDFKIIKSKKATTRSTLISPDVSTCKDCLSELADPTDRRFKYPFINCTNCGPRYTIIEDIPYDRPKTSMKLFEMCPDCKKEYEDPLNRRFHAQPNACPDCGPSVFLTDTQGHLLERDSNRAILRVADRLKKGDIIAVKGLGGFHLACDASNEASVARLRQRKKRPHKPFALMAKSVSVLEHAVHIDVNEKSLLESYHRPIVLLNKKNQENDVPKIANSVAPKNTCLGAMLPYTPLHMLLLEAGPDILVMTSGNRSGEPLSIDNDDALNAFSHIADLFLLHDRDIYFRADDSIARIQKDKTRFVRRSRGYAPLPIPYEHSLPKILACGAGLKNTICLTRDKSLFLSQHIGDLENVKIYDFYRDTISHLKQILDIKPNLVVHDLHPGLMSTQYAQGLEGVETIAVQHHHAHAVACMAENHLNEPVIAITLDGTGLGTDGSIWGGEILLSRLDGFERKAHLGTIGMPGGDAAVLEPWRMAASILYQTFGDKAVDLDIPYIRNIELEKLEFIFQMLQKRINTPQTSSCGRMFDAVSALLGICHTITHESQAAMELEALADPRGGTGYGFELIDPPVSAEQTDFIISLNPMVRQMVEDIRDKKSIPWISARFHQTLVDAFSEAAQKLNRELQIKKVVLTGGVFNNDILLNQMTDRLEQVGFSVYTHSKVPTGDGGISFGQAIAAAAVKGKIE